MFSSMTWFVSCYLCYFVTTAEFASFLAMVFLFSFNLLLAIYCFVAGQLRSLPCVAICLITDDGIGFFEEIIAKID